MKKGIDKCTITTNIEIRCPYAIVSSFSAGHNH